MHNITIPYLGKRHYVHSTSFVNYILDLFPYLDDAVFYFPKVSTGSQHVLELSSSPIEGNAYGVIDNSIYFAFKNADVDIDIPVVRNEPRTVSITDKIYRSEFIWNAVAHFKDSYDPHFDRSKGQPVIAKIQLCNFKNIQWPTSFDYAMKYTSTRTSCTYALNDVVVCKQIGITA